MNEKGENMKVENMSQSSEELANLKNVNQIDNSFHAEIGDLEITSAKEEHINELAELWANLATIQRLNMPDRFSFEGEGKNWREFVKKKIDRKQNLFLVIKKKGEYEVRGFLYLQSIKLPMSELILKGIIEDVYIKPQYRKQGLASLLMNAALDWSSQHNIKQVDCITFEKAKDLNGFVNSFSSEYKGDVDFKLVTI
jgi:GNAT superfamily N-acetyltransferase